MRKRKYATPLLVLSVASLVTYLGFSSWNLNSSAKKDFEINLDNSGKKVAYFGSRYFTSIEGALKAAEEDPSANTVYVIPGTNPTITRSCTIASNDTLCIPYDGTTWQETETGDDPGKNPKKYDTGYNGFADKDAASVTKYRKNTIVVTPGDDKKPVVITNNGKIQIGGQFGTYKNNQRPSGNTLGNYCELVLDTNTSIDNYGSIYCWGYIKEKEVQRANGSYNYSFVDNGSSLTNYSGSYVHRPLVIYDYKGGGYSSACVNKDVNVMPFNVFDFPNIQTSDIFKYGSRLKGYAALYTGGFTVPIIGTQIGETWSGTSAYIVGPETETCLFKMRPTGNRTDDGKEDNGEISFKYTPRDCRYTTNDSSDTDLSQTRGNRTKINIRSKLELASLSRSIGSIVSVDTSKYFLPISYKFDIHSLTGSERTVAEKIKFLIGSRRTVDSGAVRTINAPCVFYQNYCPQDDKPGIHVYPSKEPNSYFERNGTLKINSDFGGPIVTKVPTSKISTDNSFASNVNSSREVKEGSATGSTVLWDAHNEPCSVTRALQSFDLNSDTAFVYKKDTKVTTLQKNRTYTNVALPNSERGWYHSSNHIQYGIRYVSKNVTDFVNPSSNPTSFYSDDSSKELSPLTSKDSKDGFEGFYYDPEFTKPLKKNDNGNCVFDVSEARGYLGSLNHVKLYAKWRDRELNPLITVERHSYSTNPDGTGYLDETLSSKTFVLDDTNKDYLISGTDANHYYSFQGSDSSKKTITLKDYLFQNRYKVRNNSTVLSENQTSKDIDLSSLGVKENDVIKIYPVYDQTSDVTIDVTRSNPFGSATFDRNTKKEVTVLFNGKQYSEYLNTYGVVIDFKWDCVTKTKDVSSGWKSGTLKVSIDLDTSTSGKCTLTNNSGKDNTGIVEDNTITCIISKNNELFRFTDTFIARGSAGSCVTNDTLVARADGSYKQAGELAFGDEVLVFNHYEGKVSSGIIAFNDKDKVGDYKIIHLVFSNGKEIKIATEHGFFDVELNKYIYITENNYQNYIGHKFLSVKADTISVVTLDKAFGKIERVGVCSPGTAKHFNIVTEDILSITGGISGLFNIFELDTHLKYDKAKREKDIKKYGLVSYEEYNGMISKEAYDAFGAAYRKVAIGKGLIDKERIQYLINRYAKFVK